MEPVFPDFVKALPETDIKAPGVWTRLIAGEKAQVVFFGIPEGTSVPPHSHGAQWGFVVSGEVELTIEGVAKVYGPGDSYFIPEGAVHSAKPLTHVQAVDVFADADRYKPKNP